MTDLMTTESRSEARVLNFERLRPEGEVENLSEDFRAEGASELLEEVQRRDELLAFDYLLLDKQGNRIAGTLPITRLGWSD